MIPNQSGPKMNPVAAQVPAWMKLLLALSLTLNMVVLALIGGALVRGGPGGRPDRMAGEGFGAYAQALDREDRRRLFVEMRQGPGAGRAEREAALAAVAAALAAVPFRPEDLRSAMAAQESRMLGQIGQAHEILLSYLIGLDDGKRQEFAERLLRKGPANP